MSIIEGEPNPAPISVSLEVGGKDVTFETGKLAKQADGAVVIRSGETMVLATAQGRTEAREGADFFPLTIDVEERMYAAGKIPGGFFKREGRPTERAILTARMIDRPIRPLWPKGYRNEVQCIATVLSADMVTPHDILAINGISAALMVSPMPFLGPIGAVRIGLIDGELVVDPTLQEAHEESDLDLIVVGTKDGLTMVEAGANQVPEEQAPRGARPRAAGDRQALRGAGGAPGEGRQAEVARSRRHRGDRPTSTATRSWTGSREQGLREARLDRRRDRRGRVRQALDGVDRGRHRPRDCRCGWRSPRSSRSSARRRSRGPVREQFENDLRGAHRDRAGLEGAQVGEAAPAATTGSSRRSTCRSRSARGRRRVHEGLRQERRRARSTRTSSARRSRSTSGAPTGAPSRRSARSPARWPSARGRTARASSPAARRRSCRCSRSAPRRKASGSTTSRSRRIAASCTTTTSRRTRSGRRAA